MATTTLGSLPAATIPGAGQRQVCGGLCSGLPAGSGQWVTATHQAVLLYLCYCIYTLVRWGCWVQAGGTLCWGHWQAQLGGETLLGPLAFSIPQRVQHGRGPRHMGSAGAQAGEGELPGAPAKTSPHTIFAPVTAHATGGGSAAHGPLTSGQSPVSGPEDWGYEPTAHPDTGPSETR